MVKPQTFSDIVNKMEQDLFSLFAKSVDDGEGGITSKKESTKGHRVSTPLRMKVKRYEELAKDPELHKSLRKVRRVKDRPWEGMQVSIKKFLQKVENEEGNNKKAALGSKTLSPENS